MGGAAGGVVDVAEEWGGAWEEEVVGEDAVFRVNGGGDLLSRNSARRRLKVPSGCRRNL